MDSSNIHSHGMMPHLQASAPSMFRQTANATGDMCPSNSSQPRNTTQDIDHNNMGPQFSSAPAPFSELASGDPTATSPYDYVQQSLLYSHSADDNMIPQAYASSTTSSSGLAHQGLLLRSNSNSISPQISAEPLTSGTMGNAHSAAPRIQSEPQLRAVIRDRLPESGSPYQGYIRDLKDFETLFHAYHALNDTAKGYSGDFPEDPEALRQLVKDMVDAMVNLRDTVDAGKIPWGQITKLSPFELELKAWELIYHMRDVQDGLVGLAPWGKEWKGQAFPTFMARYDAVREKLHVSKAMVSALFDVKFAKRLALNPRAEHTRKKGNQANNNSKQQDLQLAREEKLRRKDDQCLDS